MSDPPEDDDLERDLGAMLRRRADCIASAPLIEFGDAPVPANGRWRPMILGAGVAAAVVAVLIITSVVLTRQDGQPQHPAPGSANPRSSDNCARILFPVPSRPTPVTGTFTGTCLPQASRPGMPLPSAASSPPIALGPKSCAASPSALSQLLDHNRQSVDQPANTPVATAPGGAFVMQQQRIDSAGSYSHNELAYFTPDGHGRTMWIDSAPDVDRGDYAVAVDPNAAASKDWVVFSPSVAVPPGSKHLTNQIKAWNVHTHQLLTLPHQNDAAGLGLSPFAPIVIGDIAYWIEYPTANTHRQLLIGWNVATGRVVSSQQVVDVVRLLRFGGEVALVLESGNGDAPTTRIVAGPGGSIPAAVARAGIGVIDDVVDVSSDGSTVRWAVADGTNSVQVRTWVVGSSTVSSVPVTATRSAVPRVYAGPLVVFSGNARRVLNLRTGRVTALPSNTYLDLATGSDVIVTTSTSSRSDSVSRVHLAQLTALLC